MMKKILDKASIQRVLYYFFAEQAYLDEDMTPNLSDDIFHAVLEGQRAFTKKEKQALLLYPSNRERFAFLAQLARIKAQESWAVQGFISQVIGLLAADTGDEIDRIDIKQEGYQLFFIPHDETGELWEIVIVVNQALQEITPTGFKLVDDQGEVWLSGQVDKTGEISCFWSQAESPIAKMKKRNLYLSAL